MSALIDALTARHGIPVVDAGSIDAFLEPAAGESPQAILFFTGDPAQRADSHDVAVVLPELLAAFQGRYRAAVVDRAAEAALKARFHVEVLPSLVVTRGREQIGLMARIRDWSDYLADLGRWLDPAAPRYTPPPRVAVTRSQKRIDT